MYKLAVVSTHPIQYHTPWFQALSQHAEINLKVYFCHQASAQEQAAAGFGVKFEWDIPLLEGYDYQFLNNVAAQPSIHGFGGLDVPEIAEIIRHEQFDAVLVSGWTYKGAWQTFLACWRAGIPVMVRSDSHLHTQRSPLKKLLKYPVYRAFLSRMGAGLAVGTWSRGYFLHYGVPADRVFLVPHVVDQQRFLDEAARLAPERAALRAEWNIPSEAVVYLFCGKLNDQKRPLDFVQAVRRAHAQNPAVGGLVVGDGPLRAECEAFAQAQNLPVTFAGFMNQSLLPRAYAAADVLVLPSDARETWGLVINEAMLSGLPALVSDQVGCHPDLILAGQTGDTFRMGDVDALAALMLRYAEQPEALPVLGQQARRRTEQVCGIDRVVEGVLAALKRVTQP